MLSQTLTFNYYVHLVIGYQMCTALIHGYIEYFHDFVILQSYCFIAIFNRHYYIFEKYLWINREPFLRVYEPREPKAKPQTCIK